MGTIMSGGWVIGITGASGAVYGVRLCEEMLDQGHDIHLLITDAGWRVLREELGWETAKRQEKLQQAFGGKKGSFRYYPISDIGASIASGSFRARGMVVIPCSMGTLSSIAHGASDNLMERAADVMLKENRPLLLVPRETPLHSIHLENMLKLSRIGVRLIPAMPGSYHSPSSIEQLVDFMVGKVMDSMGIEHQLFTRWGEQDGMEI
jgi:4-hydroxy-3-polyprenylbenzoate decarboxylase